MLPDKPLSLSLHRDFAWNGVKTRMSMYSEINIRKAGNKRLNGRDPPRRRQN